MSNAKTLDGAVKTEEGVAVNGCSSYPNPARKWATGRCNFATHMKAEAAGSTKVNPLKASKRAARGR